MNKAHLQKDIKKEIEQLEEIRRKRPLTPQEMEVLNHRRAWLAQLISRFGDQTDADDDEEPLRERRFLPRYRDDDERER